jgi:hypothetical protein
LLAIAREAKQSIFASKIMDCFVALRAPRKDTF